METRSIAIGLVVVVSAFAAAFGLAKSGGSKTENAGAGVKAESIKVAAPAAVGGVEVGGTLPSLRAEAKAPAKKAKQQPSSSTSAPSTSNSTTSAPTQDAPAQTAPVQQTPVQKTPVQKKAPTNEEPVRSGREDG